MKKAFEEYGEGIVFLIYGGFVMRMLWQAMQIVCGF